MSKGEWMQRRRGGYLRSLTVGAAIALLAAPAHALRCGQKVISEGDHSTRVLRFCGEPLAIDETFARRLYARDLTAAYLPTLFSDILVEKWTYNFGPNRLMHVVTIEEGIVVDIRTMGYGFSP